MRNKPFLLLLTILYSLVFWNCVKAQPVQKIYINPKNPAVQKQSSFVDSIQFIPLELVAGTGFNDYTGLRLTDKYFLVTDYGSQVLYIYSRTGSFIKKVNTESYGSPVYKAKANQLVFFSNNKNYTLTSKDRVKIEQDWANKRNLKYFTKYVIDLNDTTFAIRKVRPDKYDLTNGYSLYDDYYVQTRITTSSLYPDSIGHELKIYKDDRLLKSYFPYNRLSEPKFLFEEEEVTTISSDTPYVSYVTRPYCDTIYKLTKDSLYPVYQLVMPLENSIPATFFSNAFHTKTDRQNFRRNNGWLFHQVYYFLETSRLIYMAISFFTRTEAFVYDKQAKTIYNTTKIKTSPEQYNLSLLSLLSGARSGNRFYRLLKAGDLAAFFKQNPGTNVPKELADFLQKDPDKNSPVLVQYKLKD